MRILGWLLTPFVVWAASFVGGWSVGALVVAAGAGAPSSTLWMVVGGVVGGVVAGIGWVVLMRRRDG